MNLFASSDYVFTGKHSSMINDLVSVWKIFPTNASVIPVAALLGVLFHKKVDKDHGSAKSSVPLSALSKLDSQIQKAFQLVILNSSTNSLDNKSTIDRLFRYETGDKEDIYTFDSFVRGGIEVLHESISANGADDDLHYMTNIYNLVNDIEARNGNVTSTKVLETIKNMTQE